MPAQHRYRRRRFRFPLWRKAKRQFFNVALVLTALVAGAMLAFCAGHQIGLAL